MCLAVDGIAGEERNEDRGFRERGTARRGYASFHFFTTAIYLASL
jgi:hypothetical protein